MLSKLLKANDCTSFYQSAVRLGKLIQLHCNNPWPTIIQNERMKY